MSTTENEVGQTASKCGECGQPVDLKCSACKLETYCSRDHQKQHWKLHKLICRPFEVRVTPDLGRHLVATRDIAANDLILTESPLVYGPRPHTVEEGPVPCVGCFRLIMPHQSLRCEGCGWPVCETSCPGLKDPTNHGLECLILGLRPESIIHNFHDFYRQDVLLALRCLLLQKKGTRRWERLMEMEAHMEKRGPETEIHKLNEERVVNYLHDNFLYRLQELELKAQRDLLSETTPSIIQKICGIIDVNALEINQDAELSAIYSNVCMLEHSCISNTYHAFEDAVNDYRITLRAAMPIKKGEHLSTTYTHVLWGTQARRQHLRETKYFNCECRRCSDPTEMGTYLSALLCIGLDDIPCGGSQLPLNPLDDNSEWACDKCQVRVGGDEVAQLINKIGEEVDFVQLSDPTVREMTVLLEKIETFLHPHHYHVYSVKHSLVQLYGYQQGYLPNQISDEILIKKADMCRQLIDITRMIDPGNSRLPLYLGVLLHELFLADAYFVKRKWHIEDKQYLIVLIDEAMASLAEAKDALKCENTSAARKLRSLLSNSNKELRNWLERYHDDVESIRKHLRETNL